MALTLNKTPLMQRRNLLPLSPAVLLDGEEQRLSVGKTQKKRLSNFMFSSRCSVMVKLLSDPSTTKFVRQRTSCSSDSANECHPVTKITLHLPPN